MDRRRCVGRIAGTIGFGERDGVLDLERPVSSVESRLVRTRRERQVGRAVGVEILSRTCHGWGDVFVCAL